MVPICLHSLATFRAHLRCHPSLHVHPAAHWNFPDCPGQFAVPQERLPNQTSWERWTRQVAPRSAPIRISSRFQTVRYCKDFLHKEILSNLMMSDELTYTPAKHLCAKAEVRPCQNLHQNYVVTTFCICHQSMNGNPAYLQWFCRDIRDIRLPVFKRKAVQKRCLPSLWCRELFVFPGFTAGFQGLPWRLQSGWQVQPHMDWLDEIEESLGIYKKGLGKSNVSLPHIVPIMSPWFSRNQWVQYMT